MQFPGWNRNQSMEETAKSPLPQGASRILTMLSSPHPSRSGQSGSTETGRCSPGRRLLFPLHLRGLQPSSGWGSALAASSPHGHGPFGHRPSRPGSLFTSASCGPTLKCFLPAAREARVGHTRFQAARTRLSCLRDPAPLRAWPHPPGLLISLFSYAQFSSHTFWKQWYVPQNLLTAPPNAQMDVSNWKMSLETCQGPDLVFSSSLG